MGQSAAHTFGEIIGHAVELAVSEPLNEIAEEYGLYLDRKGPRGARGGRKKVSWIDARGNSHDLDYVLEAGGTADKVGLPKAFIEVAWRRYTKHSKNKAQEIEGAVGHLHARFKEHCPFLGAVLLGDHTEPAKKQLRSHGFHVIHFPYQLVIDAFASVGIDASSTQATLEAEFEEKIGQYKALPEARKSQITEYLRDQKAEELAGFLDGLRTILSHKIESITVMPLHGPSHGLVCIEDAVRFIESYDEAQSANEFRRYQLAVRYSSGAKVDGEFPTKAEAVSFLSRIA